MSSRLDTIRNADAPNARANDLHPPTPPLAHRLPQLLHASGMPHEVRRYAPFVPVHGVVHRRWEIATQMCGNAWQDSRDELRVRGRVREGVRPAQHRGQFRERRGSGGGGDGVLILLRQAGRVKHDPE